MAAALVAWRRSCPAAPRPADPSSATAPPAAEGALAFETTEVDLGRLAPGESRRVEVPWQRVGAGVLRVREVVPGCGCVVARGLAGALEAGSQGVLAIDVAGRPRKGPFSETVRVLVDRPPDDVVTLRVRGFVGDEAVVSPGALVVGPVRPGERVVRWVTVRAPPGQPPPPVDALLAGICGTVRGLPPGRKGAVGWDLEVTLVAPSHPGRFAGALAVRVAEATLASVPIDGVVEGPP